MNKLKEKGNYQNYDAHYVPVVPANASNAHEMNYFPCKPNQKHVYREVVVFDVMVCLPRYFVKLQQIPVKSPLLLNPKPSEEKKRSGETADRKKPEY
jgi:hypothetical protein